MSYMLRFVGGLLRVRYLVLGSAVGGSVGLSQKYEEWKKSLPEMPDVGWMKKLFPNEDSLSELKSKMNNFTDSITLEEWSTELSKKSSDTINTFNEWIEEANRNLKTSTNNNNRMERPQPPKSWELDKSKLDNSNNNRPMTDTFEDDNSFGGSKRPTLSQVLASTFTGGSNNNDDTKRKNQETLNRSELVTLRKEVDKLKKENRELRTILSISAGASRQQKRKIKKSLMEILSELCDMQTGLESSYKVQDHLPRVVVVGDQSAGKTSVLEMIAGARIFPRGAGEMMTRAPVQVTLSEGPYHVARFKDRTREFDLTKESELADLRHEIETMMRKSVQSGKTVSSQVISLTIQGPGIQRMVLIDLPGIIGTVTSELAPDTKDSIKKMVQEYMGNPNSIILCIQDGSLDAERSIFTDLVHEVDQKGRRTILVLTKVDLAERENTNPQKIKKILDGELFPIKALGYYAVVAGKSGRNENIQDIRDYEEQFFLHSSLCEQGILNPAQCTTRNLSAKVSECFWSIVKASVEQLDDRCKATMFNLQAEWSNSFPSIRPLTRDELFLIGKNEVLDEVAKLSRLSTKFWNNLISTKIWNKWEQHVFKNIDYPASCDPSHFQARIDIELQKWVESLELRKQAIQCAQESAKEEFHQQYKNSDGDRIYDKLKEAVIEETLNRHTWKPQALDVLKVVQLEAMAKQTRLSKEDWEKAIGFWQGYLEKLITATEHELTELAGPGFYQRWLKWKYLDQDQRINSDIVSELEKVCTALESNEGQTEKQPVYTSDLSKSDFITVKRNLASRKIDTSEEAIARVWKPLQKLRFLNRQMTRANECSKLFYFYENDLDSDTDCSHVMLFSRIQRMLEFTTNSLTRQLLEDEFKRIERKMLEVLDEYSEDDDKKVELLSGKRVELAEAMHQVRQYREKIEEFNEVYSEEV